ncbi:MAG: type II toxin-antitoxin system YafQ family toxin [Propionibacteriaceae bacterium]|nr:type II toxin-antitoxin system YafQ family toxin [Propionibacteriaceae bacterium]
MLTLVSTSQFRRDSKLARKRGLDLSRLGDVVDRLLREEALPARYQDHALSGPYIGKRECHIAPDWLFVYHLVEDQLVADRTGTHADLFSL